MPRQDSETQSLSVKSRVARMSGGSAEPVSSAVSRIKMQNVIPLRRCSPRLSELTLAAMRSDYSMAIFPLKVFDTYSKTRKNILTVFQAS